MSTFHTVGCQKPVGKHFQPICEICEICETCATNIDRRPSNPGCFPEVTVKLSLLAGTISPHRLDHQALEVDIKLPSSLPTVTKEGVLLRNISAAPICDHFTVGPPGSRIREVGLF